MDNRHSFNILNHLDEETSSSSVDESSLAQDHILDSSLPQEVQDVQDHTQTLTQETLSELSPHPIATTQISIAAFSCSMKEESSMWAGIRMERNRPRYEKLRKIRRQNTLQKIRERSLERIKKQYDL